MIHHLLMMTWHEACDCIDVIHAIEEWTSGTVYDEYAHDYSSSDTNSGATSLFSATLRLDRRLQCVQSY